MSRSRPAALTRALPAAFLLLTTSGPAFATGMPQLDFSNPLTLWQVVWGAGVFVLLYLLLSGSALPRVGRVLENRQSRIRHDLEVAHEAKSEADRALDELRRTRREAAAEAQANLDRVLQEAREQAHARNRAAAEDLKTRLAEAETRIRAEREQALAALPTIAAEAAGLLIERVTGQAAEPELVRSQVRARLS